MSLGTVVIGEPDKTFWAQLFNQHHAGVGLSMRIRSGQYHRIWLRHFGFLRLQKPVLKLHKRLRVRVALTEFCVGVFLPQGR